MRQCEPHPSCHRCPAGILEFLRTDLPVAAKTMHARREEIEHAASGDVLREHGMGRLEDGPVVEWDEDGSNVRPGPNVIHYEAARKSRGAHLLNNAFWKIKNFCVQQMLLRDFMHAIDLGAIIRLIMAILRKYFECIEKILDKEGLAASRLEARLRMYLRAPMVKSKVVTCIFCVFCIFYILCILCIFYIFYILCIL